METLIYAWGRWIGKHIYKFGGYKNDKKWIKLPNSQEHRPPRSCHTRFLTLSCWALSKFSKNLLVKIHTKTHVPQWFSTTKPFWDHHRPSKLSVSWKYGREIGLRTSGWSNGSMLRTVGLYPPLFFFFFYTGLRYSQLQQIGQEAQAPGDPHTSRSSFSIPILGG